MGHNEPGKMGAAGETCNPFLSGVNSPESRDSRGRSVLLFLVKRRAGSPMEALRLFHRRFPRGSLATRGPEVWTVPATREHSSRSRTLRQNAMLGVLRDGRTRRRSVY